MINSSCQKTVLDNGIRVVTEAIPHVRSVSMGIWVDVGSRDEDVTEGGISHILEHMIFKGTPKRTALDIAKELDAIGGMSNAFTCKEQTCFHAKVLDMHLDHIVELLVDIFRNSLFNPEDIEREKMVVLQEIGMVEDTPDEYVHVLFNRNFWGDNPLGRPILGEAEIVKQFDHEKIIRYINKTYIPSKIVVSAAGNLEHDRFVNMLKEPLGDMESGSPEWKRQTPQTRKMVKAYSKPLEQVHVCLGGLGPASTDESRYADTVLNTILGGNMSSRLFQEIREKRGLAYSIFSYMSIFADVGLMGVYMGVHPDSVVQSLELVQKEFEKLMSGRLETAELEAAKEYLKGSILLNSENTDNRMTRLAKNEIVLGRFVSFEEVLQRIDEVTVDEVVDLACKRLDPESISVNSLGAWDGDLKFPC